jgi:hypothetical protein
MNNQDEPQDFVFLCENHLDKFNVKYENEIKNQGEYISHLITYLQCLEDTSLQIYVNNQKVRKIHICYQTYSITICFRHDCLPDILIYDNELKFISYANKFKELNLKHTTDYYFLSRNYIHIAFYIQLKKIIIFIQRLHNTILNDHIIPLLTEWCIKFSNLIQNYYIQYGKEHKAYFDKKMHDENDELWNPMDNVCFL